MASSFSRKGVSMFYLTQYEFEVAAKNAVIDILKEKIKLKISELNIVTYSVIDGNQECTIEAKKLYGYLFLTHFSCESGRMYVRTYEHKTSDVFEFDDIDIHVKESGNVEVPHEKI